MERSALRAQYSTQALPVDVTSFLLVGMCTGTMYTGAALRCSVEFLGQTTSASRMEIGCR